MRNAYQVTLAVQVVVEADSAEEARILGIRNLEELLEPEPWITVNRIGEKES